MSVVLPPRQRPITLARPSYPPATQPLSWTVPVASQYPGSVAVASPVAAAPPVATPTVAAAVPAPTTWTASRPPIAFMYPSPVAPSAPVAPAGSQPIVWNNRLKELFHNRQAVIYLLHIRTFGAEDKNGDGRISPILGENGTFDSAIRHLDELAALGVNTIHMLPVHPIGKIQRLGEAGSPYAPSTMHAINPEYGPRGASPEQLIQEARRFVQEAHKRGIHVMADIPSCASLDLAQKHPEMIAKDQNGKLLTPTNWIDIRMFESNPALVNYYQGFFDMMVNQVGVDGFRVDVARARPTWFWQHFINQYPNLAWLAETYTTEDASPLKNIPRDVPEPLLVSGFDSIYGQFHIVHAMKNADEYMRTLIDGNAMLKRTGQGKSFIGSFSIHDDPSLMTHGGVPMCLLASGLMAFQPWTNPYIMDGFTTGYTRPFDIFTYNTRPQGRNPEIGAFLKQMLDLRKRYQGMMTNGVFIPVPVFTLAGNHYKKAENNQIISFAYHHRGKTILIVANKDINARHTGTLYLPGMKTPNAPDDLPLVSVAASPGNPSTFTVARNRLDVELGAGRFHLFEIDTPELPTRLKSYW